MDLKLHANATTTPRTRAYIQHSDLSVAALAGELGVSETTVRRWRRRSSTEDRSHQPHRINTSLSPVEERIVVELRTTLELSLDDIVEVVRRCLNPALSRSAIHRCLQRHGVSAKAPVERPTRQRFVTNAPAGFIHIDLKHLPALKRQRSYAYVAIDRATRFVYLETHENRRAETAAAFVARFLDAFPIPVHTILTDNGAEFTDRFAVDKPGKPHDRPSGDHPVDILCAKQRIRHILTRPFRPQTNGLVERFNRRIADAIRALQPANANANAGKNKFLSHQQRNAFLDKLALDYNRTRLRCLDYKAPVEALYNLSGHNTFAGEHLLQRWRIKP
jgi:transposase-like protein